ncbi:S66 peptidase family protein [Prochlorococcus marinus]|uniref:S66 peptidase family protein n=1 Tax=Prochlorococcus marinus TaxID=1219 RepID=UPI0022B3B585|nr:LD-carboxypeptidase [Prochlorococcus marinus]
MTLINQGTITKPLQTGDKVLSIAVSSPVNNKETLLQGLKILKEWGLIIDNKVEIGRHWGYFSGEDALRHDELYPAKTPSLTAFAKGGWGSARLLEYPQPWKVGWVLGYSDISSLLLARLKAGFDGGVHGPMISTLATEPKWSKERLRSLLFDKSVPSLYGEPWVDGIGHGPLIATNLTVGSHLLGSSHMPNLKGAILVIEDIGEAPYRIDRMLTQWRLNGLLQNLAGLAFGTFRDCESQQEDQDNQSFNLQEILKERSMDLNIPVVANLPVGHCCGNAALPLGWEATLNGQQGTLSLFPCS